ncbi:ATP-binding protein [Campylobacter coli]|uniref:ATP-binding protein n=1 Tax=Campylobacter coli TaxID=195 RepID=UPI00073EAEA5|nr:ATP-binding protein [Campylobacter coli]EAI3897985.1 ATP-binding protein [Campylobacter coli]EAJ0098512.1 ATP-binding protein [Campylobacter coli]EAJ7021227.1 ATP-binding protein [Campylobacter coli]EAW0593470.1 ATP-binding protein [Campylobacter coli]ECR0827476.1 ATP-binding protein [Campylobacter coli]
MKKYSIKIKLHFTRRSKYQYKRYPKRISKKTKCHKILDYDTEFDLNPKNIDILINDVEFLSKKKRFTINFQKLKSFNLGMCLIFTSLLESCKNKKYSLNSKLMPKDKYIRNMFKQTGIFDILCNEIIEERPGMLKILKINLIKDGYNMEKILMDIKHNLIEFAIYNLKLQNSEVIIRKLLKVFMELLVNIAEHARAFGQTIYLAGEIKGDKLRFAILDKGIGFHNSMEQKNRNVLERIKNHFSKLNYIELAFETNNPKYRKYSGEFLMRGNGTRRLKETINLIKNSKLQIVSKKDYYQLTSLSKNSIKYESIKTHDAIGTLIYIELPIRECEKQWSK